MKILPMLSARQVAAVLGVSTATVRRMIERKDLTPVKVGNLVRFYAADVAEKFNLDLKAFDSFIKDTK